MDPSSSQRTAGDSPRSAARYVRRSSQAMLAARICNSVHRAERLALIEWAAESNRILEPTFVEQFWHVSSGAEHAVFHDQCNALAIKATHPNRFCHSARGDGTPATPLEYLRRLGWHNLLFGDDVR